MRARTAVWLVAIVLAPELWAQDQGGGPLSTLTSGDSVRLKLADRSNSLRATVESVTTDELVLRQSGVSAPLRLSVDQLQSLEVARGRTSYWRRGAVIGFVPGVLIFGLAGGLVLCDPYASDHCFNTGLALFSGVIGGAASGSVGALIGHAFKTDRWVRVHERKPKVGVMLAPAKGDFRASLSVSF